MNKYIVRNAVEKDIPAIENIFAAARKFMFSCGNPQWQNGFPDHKFIEEGVYSSSFRVLVCDCEIAAVYSVFDSDEEYDRSGCEWLTGKNAEYLAAHTLAVAEKFRGEGLGRLCVEMAAEEARSRGKSSVRMDTHEKNIPMQKLLASCGFVYCGRLKPIRGEFLCFEKIIG